jgi:hypothetical protein
LTFVAVLWIAKAFCRHGNALVSFDKDAENHLVRKIDWAILPPVTTIYLFCFIDRANIGNARHVVP